MFTYDKRIRVSLDTGTDTRTEQSHKDSCYIYNILKQYSKTGIIDRINSLPPVYETLPDQMDYQQALALVADAGEAFDALPSAVRKEYNNDPAEFLADLYNPASREKLEEWGIFAPKAPAAQPAVPPSPEGAP